MIRVHFAWFDLWVGAFWDRVNRVLYVCPIPMLVIRIDLARKGFKLQCHGKTYYGAETKQGAFRISEAHILKCPVGAMPWAEDVKWYRIDGGWASVADGQFLDHAIVKVTL